MITIDRTLVRAGVAQAFAAGAAVERWPEWLPHYRWVRFLERRDGGGIVEMAAYRPFGPFNYPTWWVSEMTIERDAPRVRYRHIRGITTGMDVAWDFAPRDGGTLVTITHRWTGPRWPLIGRLAADLVIGPLFIHGIASRTLAGIARQAELAGDRPRTAHA
jgi:ribosome-associated toxin RatA of RatAB toxin-antitoxin module